MTKTAFLDGYVLFYEVAYTIEECVQSVNVGISNRSLGQLLRSYK